MHILYKQLVQIDMSISNAPTNNWLMEHLWKDRSPEENLQPVSLHS